MAVEFNYSGVLNEFKGKRQKALTQTAFMGVNIAAMNVGKIDNKAHIDVGTSKNSKQFHSGTGGKTVGLNDDTIKIETGQDYDVYLERRFGIMARAFDEIKPWFSKFIKDAFNG